MGPSRVWGDRSPTARVLFDMEIHRPVEFGQLLLSIRFGIWDLAMRRKENLDEHTFDDASALLLEQLLQLGEVSDILLPLFF